MSSFLNLNPYPSPEESPRSVVPKRPATPVTLTLIGLNVVIFLAMVLSGVSFLEPTAGQVMPWGANFAPLTLSGEWWRLLTACFLHFGIIHIAMNMYILFQIGFFTEMLFGSARYLLLYLLAGIGGNIAGLYFHPFTVGAGASGAIFGLYGGVFGFLLICQGVVPRQGAISIAKSATIFILYNLIFGLASPSTDLVAHVAGLLTGLAVGSLLAWSLRAATPSLRSARAIGAAILCCCVAVAFARSAESRPAKVDWVRSLLLLPSVTVGNKDRVVYTGNATQAEAQAVGDVLVQTGVFAKPNLIMLLKKDADSASLSIPFTADETLPASTVSKTSKLVDGKNIIYEVEQKRPPYPWEQRQVLNGLTAIGPKIASAAGTLPFTIRLVNGKGELRKELKIDNAAAPMGK